jgi:hypothetical protein
LMTLAATSLYFFERFISSFFLVFLQVSGCG